MYVYYKTDILTLYLCLLLTFEALLLSLSDLQTVPNIKTLLASILQAIQLLLYSLNCLLLRTEQCYQVFTRLLE